MSLTRLSQGNITLQPAVSGQHNLVQFRDANWGNPTLRPSNPTASSIPLVRKLLCASTRLLHTNRQDDAELRRSSGTFIEDTQLSGRKAFSAVTNMAGDEHMRDAEPEPSAEPSVDVEEDDWDAVNAEGTPEGDGTQDVGPEESFDTEDEDDEVVRAVLLCSVCLNIVSLLICVVMLISEACNTSC